MKRLNKCINFQLKSMIKSTLYFMIVYFLVSAALFSLSISDGANSSFHSGFYIGSAIYVFIYVIASYKENYNYLLMFSNSRKNIFLSSVVTIAAMSVFLSFVSVISIKLDGLVSKLLNNTIPDGDLHILSILYKDPNIASVFLWLTTFFIAICSFSLLYSALAYKFGKVFITLFWILFGTFWFVTPIGLISNGLETKFFMAIVSYFYIDIPVGILLAPINFMITAVILGAAAYVLSRRQSQAV